MDKKTRDNARPMKSRTKLVHAGRKPAEQFGFVNTPIYRGSTVLYPDYETLQSRANLRFTYGTHGTPTTEALEEAWSEIAEAAGTVLTPSGLAAITVALLTAVKAGDHILVTDSVYRPSRNFCDTILKRMGVETTYYDPLIGAGIEALVRPNTTTLFMETPGSQSFEMQDIDTLVAVAKAKNLCTIVDNTWGTPLFFKAHAKGIDMSADAGTKYLSGHSDLLLGVTTANEAWIGRLKATFNAFAMCAGPEDAFLALRGLRTLDLRLREAERQGLAMARWLETRPEVSRVLHPALPSCPGHALWQRDFTGSSGLFSVILKPAPRAAVAAFFDGLTLFGMGFSWGGYESLVVPFDCAPYRTATAWHPEGPALRLSIGLEDLDDLKADLDAAFDRLRSVS